MTFEESHGQTVLALDHCRPRLRSKLTTIVCSVQAARWRIACSIDTLHRHDLNLFFLCALHIHFKALSILLPVEGRVVVHAQLFCKLYPFIDQTVNGVQLLVYYLTKLFLC